MGNEKKKKDSRVEKKKSGKGRGYLEGETLYRENVLPMKRRRGNRQAELVKELSGGGGNKIGTAPLRPKEDREPGVCVRRGQRSNTTDG